MTNDQYDYYERVEIGQWQGVADNKWTPVLSGGGDGDGGGNGGVVMGIW